jgi:uncharacterized protein YjbI with pentapeptide repeats
MLVVGLLVGGVLAFTVDTFANTPSTLTTCTKVNRHGVLGKTKVSATGSCSGTQKLQTWTDSRYLDVMKLSQGTSSTTNFTGLNLSDLNLPGINGSMARSADFSGDNFTSSQLVDGIDDNFVGANFTGATIGGDGSDAGAYWGSDFNGANFTNAFFAADNTGTAADFNFNGLSSATFLGAIWNNTTCPDQTNSNSDGNTCVGHGIP